MNLIANVGLFKIGWLACVYGAASGFALEGCLLALLIVAFSVKQAANWQSELITVGLITLVGLLWESFMASQHLMIYATQSATQDGLTLAPYWLIVMWALFATTINQSMGWLKHKLLIAAVLGAIFGPLAFVAGEKLGAVVFLNESVTMTLLTIGWAILMPLVCIIARRVESRYTLVGAV
tara:strand:+ start:489 stop:1028 length:540 start_codon:yes stop_codon:yes gene_type:complete